MILCFLRRFTKKSLCDRLLYLEQKTSPTAKQALQAAMSEGGLVQPSFLNYLLASQLSYVYKWLYQQTLSASLTDTVDYKLL